ncbi:patatin-like phospholipase family protein [Bradyrhizobium aeschynomenes]|uniref:patatin-like phospholipase family protein n=1 Tax=Bradyrhizobium aeschynomenes TaxID=2734909 RepID=UPI001554231F|nr:patatin-like phospholipase family protein [Bradyrhizobium aeschynomenes]NPV22751.1 protein teg [Bradyrhizobium aeschynomenes]
MTHQRILAMDGGISGYVTAEVLRRTADRIGRHGGHFLDSADIIAGTSAGGLNALFLAAHEDPDHGIEGALGFWEHILDTTFTFKPTRLVAGFVGAKAFDDRQRMIDFLVSYFGADTRLGDLKRRVVVPAFQLHHEHAGERQRQWRPRLFHNIPGILDYSPDERVVDVALRTSNIPVISPIFASIAGGDIGYLDGGLVANNPSMCAVSAVFEQRRAAGQPIDVESVSVLSVGCGRKPLSVKPEIVDGIADWGYGQWLLSPKEPMLLVRLAIRGGGAIIEYQCAQLLGTNFKRIDPYFNAAPHPFDVGQTRKVIEDALAHTDVEAAVDEICQWLHVQGWIGDVPPGPEGRDVITPALQPDTTLEPGT